MRTTAQTAELRALLGAVTTMADRVATLVASAPDPHEIVRATPAWSIAEVLGHIGAEAVRYRELALGRGDWPATVPDLPTYNAAQVAAMTTKDVAIIGDQLREATVGLVATWRELPADATMRFDGGLTIDCRHAPGTFLGELVVHGYDIAQTIGHPWTVEPAYIPMIMDGLHQVLPGWVDPVAAAGHSATYEMRFRGLATHLYKFRDGQLTVNPPEPGRIDVHISATPTIGLLNAYGRVGQVRPALLGQVTTWGRRPWLAPGLAKKFYRA